MVDSANSARLRLLRLSEAAEKLRRQAAISMQTGKENDAREALFQKKKVMLALEKSKSRIELLDELSTKLNEVNEVVVIIKDLTEFFILKYFLIYLLTLSGIKLLVFLYIIPLWQRRYLKLKVCDLFTIEVVERIVRQAEGSCREASIYDNIFKEEGS